MAISFDWYENPVSPDKPEEKRFHPRIIANGQIDTKDLRSRIQSRCTLNEVDVTAVLDALSQVMGEELCEGRQVHLDGIGYFYPTLTATEEIAADTPRRNTKVKLKGIQFRSDQKTEKLRRPYKNQTDEKNYPLSQTFGDGYRQPVEKIFHRSSDHATFGFSRYNGYGSLNSHDSHPPPPHERQVAEHRHTQSADIRTGAGILRKARRLSAGEIMGLRQAVTQKAADACSHFINIEIY